MLAFMPGVALAEQAAAEAPSAGLEEIVVTAQRRSESAINVPLTMTAISGENLKTRGIESITDLRFQTPGFISLSGTGYTQLFIRGIGNNIFVGADPSVANFVDDVPRVYGSLIDNFINVERVEVLKGAQGGLYGRNATGGVVNTITRQPGNDFALQARGTYGEYNSREIAAYVNVPISEQVAFNVSGLRKKRDGYIKNLAVANPYPAGTTSFFGNPNSVVRPRKLNDADFYALDGKLRLDATDRLRITLAGDYARKHDADGNGWKQLRSGLNYAVYNALAGQGGLSFRVPAWRPAGKREAYAAIDSFSYTVDYGFSAKVAYEAEGVDLLSITALRYNNSNFRGDIGAGAVPMAGFFTDFNRNNFYQELRAVSNGTGPLRYVAGATYYKDKVESSLIGLFLGFNRPATLSTLRTRNYSVYGEVSYDFTDALTLTSSLRYVSEKKNIDFPAQAGFGAISRRTNQHKLLPSANLSYKFGDGLVFIRYAKGFKTGGINPIVLPQAFGTAPGSEFGGEVVDAFEGGFKGSFMDRRVQLTAAVFYNDFKGIQIARAGNAANPTVSNAILNAGTARTYGAEGSLSWRVIPAVTLSANLGYLNAKYKNASYPGSPVVDPFNASGNRMALAPKWQGGVTMNLDTPINDKYRVLGNILYSYVGHFNFQYEENPFLEEKSYSIVNARVGVGTIDEKVTVYLFANNLFDKVFNVFATSNSLGALKTEGPPRVIGGTVEFKF